MSDQTLTPETGEIKREEVKPPFYKKVANELIAKIEQGVAPWQKPWESGKEFMPYNPATGKPYRGFNAINLMSQSKDDPRWLTYKQAASIGAYVKQGEKGTPIVYYEFEKSVPKLDANGRPLLDDKGKEIKEVIKLEQPQAIWASVFNASQIGRRYFRHQRRPLYPIGKAALYDLRSASWNG
jgi:antirestriction protein ArdC